MVGDVVVFGAAFIHLSNFPTQMKLTECRRVVLLHYDPELKRVELRHYYVNAKPVGVSKSVKRIIQTDVPDMHELQDISEYVLK